MLLRNIILLFCLVSLGCGQDPKPQAPPPNQWIQSFASPFLEMAKPGKSSQIPLLRWLYESPWLTYEAGSLSEKIPAECEFRNYRLLNSAHEDRGRDLVADYLQKCEFQIATGPKDFFRNLYRTLFIRFPMESHPYLHRVILNLPGGFQLPGVLALKDDKYPRPLVIVRAGIFGNSVEMQAERFMVIQFFEQGNFNVLFLDSLTSPETLKLNSHLSVGGLDEGIQNYLIASRLQDPQEPLQRLISEVHLAAISMGGHGMLMAMILNETNPRKIQSAVGLCPLVQMEKTFLGHESDPLGFSLINIYASLRMPELFRRIPGISRTRFLPESFQWVAENYQGPLSQPEGLRFPEGFPRNDFHRGNDLLPWLKEIHQPVSIFASRRDHLVPYALNAGEIERQGATLPSFRVYPLSESFHCSLPGAYSWTEMSDILNTVTLSAKADRDLPAAFRRMYWPIPDLRAAGMGVTPQRRFELKEGDEVLTVHVQKENGSSLIVQIPLDALGWGTQGKVRTEAEAGTLLRWAQQFVQVGAYTDGELKLVWPVPAGFSWNEQSVFIQ